MKSWLSRWTGKAAEAQPEKTPVASVSPAQALITEGHQLEDAGRITEALQCYRRALAADPGSAPACLNQGNALQGLGDHPAAVASYRQALALDAESAPAWLTLGNALLLMPSQSQAERKDFLLEAEAAYRSALRVRPDWAQAWFGLGCALEAIPAVEEACAAYSRALEIEPELTTAGFNLSDLLAEQHVKRNEINAARQVLSEALEKHPGQSRLLARLADLERECGRVHESLALLRQMVANSPDYLPTHSSLLFSLNFLPEISSAELFEAHAAFGRLVEARTPLPTPCNVRDPHRRLKVGYVSADFRRHPVAVFMLPILRHHARELIEVYSYNNLRDGDAMSESLREASDHWRDIFELDDAVVANIIRDDGIDILIDLSGHTSGGRMALFALKPAPVQMTWLGYLGTTGLSRMDYRLCDARTDPVGVAEACHTEALLRLPDTQWCYDSQLGFSEPTPLPYLSRGYWTFGSFNNGLKLNDTVLATWAQVLNRLPKSRLRIFSMENEEIRNRTRVSLAKHGITTDRVDLIARIPVNEYFASFGEVDVALDSFPYSGGTTTCDTLLMGLPVATIAGERTIARSGVSLLGALGLDDWIADSAQALPELLRRRLAEPERLAALRAELPARMRASALMDAPRFTQNLERLYREAWRRWCGLPL